MAARTLEWPPLRSTAMAELVMSSAAILFSLILQAASGLGRFIVIAALYGVVAVLMAVVWRTWQAGHEATATSPVNDLAEACALIAAERNLSPREAEVLALLAEGRSRTFIMEKLVISDATVKSHTNHVYQKLGVHSKQDLITLVRER
ncbi:helix-turn-helix transcriptional regulator [uncultured Adlercreutzia sp.]|uniref:helix-turn-helix transcriptional regulator n=1 Tax=uncultured Adlercreutzia sp. TaxID=875803 RepID=UPI00265C94F7|nr:helix-turn-helix transcriptional regulator [uncultured Adlercreutzia sp.]